MLKKLHLYENMRLQKLNPKSSEFRELNEFSNWILSIGNGIAKAISNNDENLDTDNNTVEIPNELLIYTTDNKIKALVESTYSDFKKNQPSRVS